MSDAPHSATIPAAPSHTQTTTTPRPITPTNIQSTPHDTQNLLPRAVALLRAGQDAPATNSRPTSSSGPYSAGLNTVTSSARTSYTRVDLAGVMEEIQPTTTNGEPQESPEHQGQAQEQEAEESVYLCFLSVSGGRRTMSFPPETAVGRAKELLLNSWPEDWSEERPPGTTYLRVLYQGKMLQDDETLLKLKFPLHRKPSSPDSPSPPPTIVHLSIRPVAPKDANTDDDTLKKRGVFTRLMSSNSRSNPPASGATGDEGDANAQAGCCGCIIS